MKLPVGELRWKAPEPLPSSENVFEAVNFGASAIQVEHSGVILKHHRQDELVRLDTRVLKEAAQKLWKDFCGPVCDGTVFPADLYHAYREGCTSDIFT